MTRPRPHHHPDLPVRATPPQELSAAPAAAPSHRLNLPAHRPLTVGVHGLPARSEARARRQADPGVYRGGRRAQAVVVLTEPAEAEQRDGA